MANGCILLSTNVGFVSGLTNQEHFIQIDRCNPKAVARKICEIREDSSAYSHIRIAGQKRVQELRWSYNIEALESEYKKMLANF